MNKTLLWFVPLLFLMTFEYRIDVGPLSMALSEPFVLLAAALVLLPKVLRREPLQWRDPLFLLFAFFVVWVLLVRPFAPDWKHGLSDVRDWALPLLFMFTLLNAGPRTPNTWLTAFVVILCFNSVIGIAQHFFEGMRWFAAGLTIFKQNLTGTAPVAAALGFFDAPNGFGLYLAAGIPLMWGWLRNHGQRFGWARYLLLLLPYLALYYSYSRMSILVTGVVTLLLLVDLLIRPTRWFTRAVAGIFALGALAVPAALSMLPHLLIRTIWWRVALWEIAGITLRESPSIWLFGNGIDRFAPLSFYPQPHNVYIFMLLEYGIIGLMFIISVVTWLVYSGFRARAQGYFAANPALAPLWLGALTPFLIGITETVWLAINHRLIFVFLATLYVVAVTQAEPSLARLPRWQLPFLPVRAGKMPREQHL